jgi:galactitol PTS system EIIC component
MDIAYKIIAVVNDIGPVGIIPSIFLLVGLVTARNKLQALKRSVFIFIGLVSVAVLIGAYINFFNPVINTIVSSSTKSFSTIDIGWMVSVNSIFRSPILAHLYIALIAVNIIMLLLRLTRTLNIDLLNYWLFIFVGTMTYAITELRWLSIFFSALSSAIVLVLSDIYQPDIENYFGVEAVSNPQPSTVVWAPISGLINYIFNKIPLIKKAHIFYEEIQYKLGIVSEPMIMGFLAGSLIGYIARYKNFSLDLRGNLLFCLLSGVNLAVIMILLPRAYNLLMKGMLPALNEFKAFINSKFSRKDFYLGTSSILFVGHPSVIGLSAIMIPLTVYIATRLPGNNVLPSADLVMIPFILVWAVAPAKGDIFRSFISALIIIPLILWITTDISVFLTDFYLLEGGEMVNGYSNISSIGAGSNVISWIFFQIIKPIIRLFF